MKALSQFVGLVLSIVIGFAVCAPMASAHSHLPPGDHVKEFEKHIPGYEEEVLALAETVDKIATAYTKKKGVEPAVKAFYDHWESVKVHEAIENVAVPLYPPIWVAYAAIQQAVNEKKPVADVVMKCDALKARLYEGLGAVRFAAIQLEQGQAPAVREAPELDQQASVKAIQDALKQSVQEYSDGNVEAAKKLVADAYLHRFEFLEGDLISKDPELVSNLEKQFNVDLPVMMNSGKSKRKVAKLVRLMNKQLDRAAELLAEGEQDKPKVF